MSQIIGMQYVAFLKFCPFICLPSFSILGWVFEILLVCDIRQTVLHSWKQDFLLNLPHVDLAIFKAPAASCHQSIVNSKDGDDMETVTLC